MHRRTSPRRDAFGNALGNAAISGIEEANAASEQKQLRSSVHQLQATQAAELGASTNAFEAQTAQMATGYINANAQTTLDQEYAGIEQALEDRLAAMPDPSLAASIAAVNSSLPQGSVTLGPLQIVEEGGHYGNAAQQQEAYFKAVGRYVDSVSVDSTDFARANAARAQQYAADLANQRALDELDRQNGLAIAKFMAIGPLGGALGVAAAASPWVAGALSAYNGYEGGQSIKDGHPIWGAIQIGAGLIGAVGAASGIANDLASTFDRLGAPMFGSPAAQAGKLDVGAFVPDAVAGPTAADKAAIFEPLGINQNPLSFDEGKRMVYALQQSGLSKQEALDAAQEFFNSGSTAPVATPIDQTELLYKLVPQGGPTPDGSSYWLNQSAYQQLLADPRNAPGQLGLPAWQYENNYDVYVTRPIGSGATVFESTVAPTRQGTYLQPGGLRQTILVDPKLFTPPAKVGAFRW